jgi:cyclopropane-fatty-acyl-phospholipid synthase
MQTLERRGRLRSDKKLPVRLYDRRGLNVSASRRIVNTLLAGYQGSIAVRLWDGSLLRYGENFKCVLHINHPGVLRDLVLHRDLVKFAEAFITGDVDVAGDFEALFELEPHLIALNPEYKARLQLLYDALCLPLLNKHRYDKRAKFEYGQQSNSRKTISHHYDVSNDFYRLWLDHNMVYSCAYFRHAEQSLDDAQQDKLDYLCRKLRLKPGQSLLDIGCGWGALALWAAQYYGVTVHGITLSEEQRALATNRVNKAGLENRIRIELRDYRDLPNEAAYDRVVSVGMFEHIGVKNFPKYFNKVKRVLKPGGLFLNHGITSKDGWHSTQLTRFMNQYIFPDGELARVSDVSDAMEKAGFPLGERTGVKSERSHCAHEYRNLSFMASLYGWVCLLF